MTSDGVLLRLGRETQVEAQGQFGLRLFWA